jgi:formylmethanofuran dehydrogenase subunit D
MRVRNSGEFLVPVHRDECGDSSSLRIFSSDYMERPPVEEQIHWAEEYPKEYTGMHKVAIVRGDRLVIKTACCKITAKVVEVNASACSIHLANVEFEGPWANFCEGSSTLTFGSVMYKTSGMEEVEATEFLGTLEQYRQLREVEPKGLPWEETAGRRDSPCLIPSPDHEHSEQLAEAAGY